MILARLLPPDDDQPPSHRDRIRFLLVAIVPWIALYEFTAHLGLSGRAFQFAFEDRLPIWSWTAVFYQSIYPAVALAPWFARTRRDLRQFTVSSWMAMAVVFPIYWIVPSTAPRRPLAAGHPIARLLAWERNTYPPTAAFPSFHVLWAIFVARIYRPTWLAAVYAAAVIVSCVTTGMHYIPDVLASLAIAPALVGRALARGGGAEAPRRLKPNGTYFSQIRSFCVHCISRSQCGVTKCVVSGHDLSRAGQNRYSRALAPGMERVGEPSGAKALVLRAISARLKSCPDTNRKHNFGRWSFIGKVCGIRLKRAPRPPARVS